MSVVGNRRYGEWAIYKRLLREARPFWGHLTLLGIIGGLATPFALLTPLPLKVIVDNVIDSRPLPTFLQPLIPGGGQSQTTVLWAVVALVVAIALLDRLRRLASWVWTTYTGEKLSLALRAHLFAHAQRLSFSYHDSKGTADSIYRIQHDTNCMEGVLIAGVMPLMSASLTFAGMVYVTARIDWQLALIALSVAPAIYVVVSKSRGVLRRGWETTKAHESRTSAIVQEVLTALRVVKAFRQEDREQARFRVSADTLIRAKTRTIFFEGVVSLLVALGTAIGTALVFLVGVGHVQSGIVTLGDLLLVAGYLAELYMSLETVSASIARWQSSLASAERVFTVLDETPDVADKASARPLAHAAGSVTYRNVSFAYDGREPVLRNVSFAIPSGARVGISGATGAGKTTLMSLLMRFYDPTAGEILLDGVDLREYRVADLREQCAVVLQEPVLFSTTVAENIAYGRPAASESEIIEAATAANAHEFILALPDGYQTLVGDRGMKLSGGQRQRVALARAFLKAAPILILDEPTSSVDLATEASIMDATERLMRGRTTFLITHRLSALSGCEVRLEIDSGQVVQVTAGEGRVGVVTAEPGVAEERYARTYRESQ